MRRSILHIDMDAFYAAVEQRDNPSLRGRPVIVGSPPDRRGVVATCSYEARRFGVRSAMPSREAFRLCPTAVFIKPDMQRYQEASVRIFKVLECFSPLVEPISIDEAFLDVSGVLRLFGNPENIASLLRRQIRAELDLPASVGIAHNKFLAKLASEKAKPDGVFKMPEQREQLIDLLGRMGVGELWGVGKVSRRILEQAGFLKVSDLQRSDRSRLVKLVGERFAAHLINLSFGEDSREVELPVAEKSISKETTFDEDVDNRQFLNAALCDLCDEVGSRLRAQGLMARVCRIKIRWSDFNTITRQQHFLSEICDDFSIRELALELFSREKLRSSVRLIGVGVTELVRDQDEQMLLFQEENQELKKREKVSRTVDAIRDKLGDNAIMRGSRLSPGD